MGLAIVNRIAQWHDARFVIGESAHLGGARFDIVFPVMGALTRPSASDNMLASTSSLPSENG